MNPAVDYAPPPQVMALSKGVETTPLADSVRKTLELFVQRMQEISAAGGSVATDPIVLSMYQNLNAMQPQLLKQIDEVQQRKGEKIFQLWCALFGTQLQDCTWFVIR